MKHFLSLSGCALLVTAVSLGCQSSGAYAPPQPQPHQVYPQQQFSQPQGQFEAQPAHPQSPQQFDSGGAAPQGSAVTPQDDY